MPANLSPAAMGQTSSPNSGGGFKAWIISKGLGTFKGWLLRQAVKISTLATATTATWFASGWQHVETTAAVIGADATTLHQLQDDGASLKTVICSLIATIISGSVSVILSRIAAKVAEQPVIPKALPV